MGKGHGALTCYQVLLGPHRAELLEIQAAKEGLKPAAYARKLIYERLEVICGTSAYDGAVSLDEASRKDAVARQVSGRAKLRQAAK